MDMSYSTNPNLPKVRAQAVKMVRSGVSTREVAKHFGYSQSAVVKWCKKVPENYHQYMVVPTESCRPRSHPRQLAPEVVQAIVDERLKHNRCAEVIHAELTSQGVAVSLSSVKRTLRRRELSRNRTKYKRPRISVPRPKPVAPGLLVEADTIHVLDWMTGKKFYIYTAIDVYSRWVHAEVHPVLRSTLMLEFILRAQTKAGFTFTLLQTDNGPEFANWFRNHLQATGITLRHTRVRTPNDNAHIERFNRSIQEECVSRYAALKYTTQEQIDIYLDYYNNERRHMGINFQKPAELIPRS